MTDITNDEIGEPLEVELPADETPEVTIAESDPAVEKVETVDDGIAELKRRLAEETQAREAAEIRARESQRREGELSQREHQARSEVRDTNLSLIDNAIAQRKQAGDMLKSRYRDAAAAQDFDAMSDIQMEMSRTASELIQLETGKQQLESAPKPTRQEIQHSDPTESLASEMERVGSKRSAQWIRDHPDYATDQRKYQKMVAAHNLATADGITPDTDAYFEAVETILKIRDATPVVRKEPEPVQQRQSAPMAAPSSRQASTTGAATSNRVTLSREEVEIAEMMGMTPQEYAKEKVALKKAGQIK